LRAFAYKSNNLNTLALTSPNTEAIILAGNVRIDVSKYNDSIQYNYWLYSWKYDASISWKFTFVDRLSQ